MFDLKLMNSYEDYEEIGLINKTVIETPVNLFDDNELPVGCSLTGFVTLITRVFKHDDDDTVMVVTTASQGVQLNENYFHIPIWVGVEFVENYKIDWIVDDFREICEYRESQRDIRSALCLGLSAINHAYVKPQVSQFDKEFSFLLRALLSPIKSTDKISYNKSLIIPADCLLNDSTKLLSDYELETEISKTLLDCRSSLNGYKFGTSVVVNNTEAWFNKDCCQWSVKIMVMDDLSQTGMSKLVITTENSLECAVSRLLCEISYNDTLYEWQVSGRLYQATARRVMATVIDVKVDGAWETIGSILD